MKVSLTKLFLKFGAFHKYNIQSKKILTLLPQKTCGDRKLTKINIAALIDSSRMHLRLRLAITFVLHEQSATPHIILKHYFYVTFCQSRVVYINRKYNFQFKKQVAFLATLLNLDKRVSKIASDERLFLNFLHSTLTKP